MSDLVLYRPTGNPATIHVHIIDAALADVTSGIVATTAIDDAAYGAVTNAATHKGSGIWELKLTSSEMGSNGDDAYAFIKFTDSTSTRHVTLILLSGEGSKKII